MHKLSSTQIELLSIRLTRKTIAPTDLSAKAEHAARHKDSVKVEAFRQRGARVNSIARGFALGGHHEEVEHYLSTHSANQDQIAVAYAIGGYDKEVERYRLAHGANPELIIRAYILANRLEHVPKYLRLGVSESFIAASYMIANIPVPGFIDLHQKAMLNQIAHWLTVSGAYSLLEKLHLEYTVDIDTIISAFKQRSHPNHPSPFFYFLSSFYNENFRQVLANALATHTSQTALYERSAIMHQMITRHQLDYETAYSLTSEKIYRGTSLLLKKTALNHTHYLEILPWRWLEIRLLFLQCHYQSHFKELPMELIFHLISFIVPQGSFPSYEGFKKMQRSHAKHLLQVDLSRYDRLSYLFNSHRKQAKRISNKIPSHPEESATFLLDDEINELAKKSSCKASSFANLLYKHRSRFC